MRTDDKMKIKSEKKITQDDKAVVGLGESVRKQIDGGASFSGHESNHFWMNREGKEFMEESGISGLDHGGDSRTFSMLDYDRDGFRDIVLVNANKPFVKLLRNRIGDIVKDPADRGRFLALRFEGGNHGAQADAHWSTRDGVGAKVLIDNHGQHLLREFLCGEGFAAENSRTFLIGIGLHDDVDSLKVVWPSGVEQRISGAQAGMLYTVYENPQQSPTGEAFVPSPYERVRFKAVAAADSGKHSETVLDFVGETGHGARLRMYTLTYTTCSACKRALPRLASLKAAFGDELAMYGVPTQPERDSAEDWAHYVEKYHPGYEPLVGLSKENVDKVAGELVFLAGFGCGKRVCTCDPPCEDGVPAPSTVVTDGEGHVITAMAGVPSVSTIRKILHDMNHAR